MIFFSIEDWSAAGEKPDEAIVLKLYQANIIGNYTANSAYERDLNRIFKEITSITKSNYGFYSNKVGEVNAMALCRADVKLDVCSSCLNYTKKPSDGLRIARYGSTADEYFQLRLREFLSDLRSKVAAGGALLKYAAGNSSLSALERLHALVQCTPDLSEMLM
ncbi:cysteine-rich receptor-like protein kinase 29 [Gossypium hirsutum]|uniref:Cysteine-rich receptor-like protein kinase 29 n=1 Tax=Gossypium hirsutum TaxID=3635 RepID=A0A1U8L913_GOSHI|nr:cysteine-rich receptor-like protein kinase 29 [Gossypium hirsutum]